MLGINRPSLTIYLEDEEAKFLDNHPALKDALVGEMCNLLKNFIKENK